MLKYFLSTLILLSCISAYPQQKYEVRAAWLTVVKALDWPKVAGVSEQVAQRQKEEIVLMLDSLKKAKFNTILFQTRMRADLSYISDIEPVNYSIAGVNASRRPAYDPLQFVVDECHKRGMECHAWIVTLPIGDSYHIKKQGKNSVVSKLSNISIKHNGANYLDPSNEKTKTYLMKIVDEIVRKYDIDGIYLDYMRYPDKANVLNDRKEYLAKNKGETHAEWRRNNITSILRHIYKGVKEVKPWVKVSVCPIGKFDNTTRYSSKGWNAFSTVSQDVRTWFKEGIVDQIYPMLYFKDNDFFPFVLQWEEISNGRHIVPGLAVYLLDSREGKWEAVDLERQINFSRQNNAEGVAYYRVEFVLNNSKNIYDKLVSHYHTTEALIPPMKWLDNEAPTTPSNLRIVEIKKGYKELRWNESKDNERNNIVRYNIYASDTYPVDISNPQNIVATNIKELSYVYSPLSVWKAKRYFAVTATDRYGNESEAVQMNMQ